MHILPPVRPEKSIERLTAILEPIAEKVHVVPRKRLTWLRKGKQQMYLFLEGELSLLRTSDGLVVVTVYEPHLFGIAEMIQPTQGHFLRAAGSQIFSSDDVLARCRLFERQRCCNCGCQEHSRPSESQRSSGRVRDSGRRNLQPTRNSFPVNRCRQPSFGLREVRKHQRTMLHLDYRAGEEVPEGGQAIGILACAQSRRLGMAN